MKKVVGIESAKKSDPCLYCGADPACYGLTCPRVVRFELHDDGSLCSVEYFEKWEPVKRTFTSEPKAG